VKFGILGSFVATLADFATSPEYPSVCSTASSIFPS